MLNRQRKIRHIFDIRIIELYCGELERIKRTFYLDRDKTDYDFCEYNKTAVKVYEITKDVFHLQGKDISIIEVTSSIIGGFIDLDRSGTYISEGKYNKDRNSYIFDLSIHDSFINESYDFFINKPLFFMIECYVFIHKDKKVYIN